MFAGDLVRWLPDGNIDFLERIDNQVPFARRSPYAATSCSLLFCSASTTGACSALTEGLWTARLLSTRAGPCIANPMSPAF